GLFDLWTEIGAGGARPTVLGSAAGVRAARGVEVESLSSPLPPPSRNHLMDVLRVDLSDEDACYGKLLELLHPGGLACPRCRARAGRGAPRRRRYPVLDYQCAAWGRVFNAWTGTPLEKTHRRPSRILKILGGILLKTPTAQLARDLQCQRAQLLA